MSEFQIFALSMMLLFCVSMTIIASKLDQIIERLKYIELDNLQPKATPPEFPYTRVHADYDGLHRTVDSRTSD